MQSTNTHWEDLVENVSHALSLTHGESVVVCERLEAIINSDPPAKGFDCLVEEALEAVGRYIEYIRENHDYDNRGWYHNVGVPNMTFEPVIIEAENGHRLYYLNNGDTYIPTIAFDDHKFAFIVTSWGDWLETEESSLPWS